MSVLSKPDQFLLNPQFRTCSVAVPGTSRNSNSENREHTGDCTLDDPCPEVKFSSHHSGNLNSAEVEDYPHTRLFEKLIRIHKHLKTNFEAVNAALASACERTWKQQLSCNENIWMTDASFRVFSCKLIMEEGHAELMGAKNEGTCTKRKWIQNVQPLPIENDYVLKRFCDNLAYIPGVQSHTVKRKTDEIGTDNWKLSGQVRSNKSNPSIFAEHLPPENSIQIWFRISCGYDERCSKLYVIFERKIFVKIEMNIIDNTKT